MHEYGGFLYCSGVKKGISNLSVETIAVFRRCISCIIKEGVTMPYNSTSEKSRLI